MNRGRAAKCLQSAIRKWLDRNKRMKRFVNKLCGDRESLYPVLRLQVILLKWREFAVREKNNWRNGVTFGALKAGYLWVEGECTIHSRKLVIFHDRIEILDEKEIKLSSYPFHQIKSVVRGSEHRKKDFTIILKNLVTEIYTVYNPWGFEAAFQANYNKFNMQQNRLFGKKKSKNIFQKSDGVEARETFLPSNNVYHPTKDECRRALGSFQHETKSFRKAFERDGDGLSLISEIQSPWKDEWMVQYPDLAYGQTYPQWKQSAPAIPAGSNRNKIYLVSVGDLQAHDGGIELHRMAEFLQSYFYGVQVCLLPPMPLWGRYKDRGMSFNVKLNNLNLPSVNTVIDASQVENYLLQLLPTDAFMLLGVTLYDITAGAGFTNGNYLASLLNTRTRAMKERVGVISLGRLDPWFKKVDSDNLTNVSFVERSQLLLRRSCVWLAQNVMICMGMHHCIYYSCCMNGFVNVEELSHIPLQACPICLRKLQDALGIKTTKRCIDRYNGMRRFCHINHRVFKRDLKWYGGRSRTLEQSHVTFLAREQMEKLFGVNTDIGIWKLPTI